MLGRGTTCAKALRQAGEECVVEQQGTSRAEAE